jgi:hypothetical protein
MLDPDIDRAGLRDHPGPAGRGEWGHGPQAAGARLRGTDRTGAHCPSWRRASSKLLCTAPAVRSIGAPSPEQLGAQSQVRYCSCVRLTEDCCAIADAAIGAKTAMTNALFNTSFFITQKAATVAGRRVREAERAAPRRCGLKQCAARATVGAAPWLSSPQCQMIASSSPTKTRRLWEGF